MASATINGVTWTDGATLSYGTTGRYLTDVRLGAVRFDVEEITSPGLDGYGTKDYGRRDTDIQLEVYYVDSSEGNIITAWITDTSGLAEATVFTATIGGVDQGTCRLVSEKCSLSQPRNCGRVAAAFRASAVLVLRRLR